MHTIEYLQSGKTIENLVSEYGIVPTYSDIHPFVILNYHQTDSRPKTHDIICECRNLILNKYTYALIAKSFHRFFNFGENLEKMQEFDWNSVIVEEKVDGSLLNFFYYGGEWHVTTRGSFANGPICNEYQAKFYNLPTTWTWKNAIEHTLGCSINELNLDKSLNYVCEFCSLWNKVVRTYNEPCIYLLTCFAGEQEVGVRPSPFKTLGTYNFKNAEEIVDYVNSQPEDTFEGCVARDNKYQRVKLKNLRYVLLHKLKGNGENLYLPKNLIPWIMSGEQDELLAVYPEITECLHDYTTKINSAYVELVELWNSTKDIPNQKDFALAIVGKTPFSSVLFQTRKSNTDLKQQWHKSIDLILKNLF